MPNTGRQRSGLLLVATSSAGLITLVGVALLNSPDDNSPHSVLDTCCSSDEAPRRSPDVEVPVELTGGQSEKGQPLFLAACANCHDDDGSGRRGRPTYPGIRDLRAHQPELSVMGKIVLHGQGRMPAFGGLVEHQELKNVLAYVQSLQINTD